MFDLEKAWEWREARGFFSETQALRVFHGPGEGQGELRNIAIERFGDHYWITEWEGSTREGIPEKVIHFLEKKKALSVAALSRPVKGVAPEVRPIFGTPPQGRFEVREGRLKFWIQFENTRHPGLFLDHAPLRKWLADHMSGLKVLNTFSYTGSLSVAAGVGGAKEVVTLDLSKPSLQWAQENMTLNGLSNETHRTIFGDVFEWLPRLKRAKESFDCIILDPPSFSHGKAGKFSTAKDLIRLHSLAMDLLSEKGILITSINSANISRRKFEEDVLLAAKEKKMQFRILGQIDLPETFPTLLGQEVTRYLKGWILQR